MESEALFSCHIMDEVPPNLKKCDVKISWNSGQPNYPLIIYTSHTRQGPNFRPAA